MDVGDINADGSPEVYIYVMSPGGEGSVVALSSNNRKSLTDIYLPPLKDNRELSRGYTGKGEAGWVFKVDRTEEF